MIKNYKKSIKINGFVKIKNFFKKSDIDKLEKNFIFFSSKLMEKYSFNLYKKSQAILHLKKKSFKKKSLIYLSEIEKFDKNIFYNLCKNFGNMYFIENIKNSIKINKLLRNYFKGSVSLIQTRNPIILFNKKKLKRLNYQWHQESQFYPEHNAGLHIWTPLFRDLKDKNDGGLQFAATGNETNFKYKEIRKKDSYIQRVPTIDINKSFETISVGANIGDAIIFENKSVHRSDINNSKTPRVATVFRYLSNVGNQSYKVL